MSGTEHGWNDPPTFSFSALQSGSSRKTQMTKRLNHTLTSTSNQSSSTETTQKRYTSIPPTPDQLNSGPSSSGPLLPPPQTSCMKEELKSDAQGREERRESKEMGTNEESESKCFDQVLTSLVKLTEKHCEYVQKRTMDEIKRRLSILSQQWQEGRLSQPVRTEMTKLTTALERGDCQIADSIHVSLMVDHTSEVNRWMTGVKRLIATMKSAGQSSAT